MQMLQVATARIITMKMKTARVKTLSMCVVYHMVLLGFNELILPNMRPTRF